MSAQFGPSLGKAPWCDTCTLVQYANRQRPAHPRCRTDGRQSPGNFNGAMSTGEPMSLLIVLAARSFLMLAAYRGHSVILMAPVAALGAVLLTDPALVAPMFTGLFMDKMVGFLKLYFPVFLLGALFGKLIEVSGFSRSIVAASINVFV